MQVGDRPEGYVSPLQREVLGLCEVGEGMPVERFAFYQRVRAAYAIVQTGEMQAYANFIFAKGVIAEPALR
jgi:L-fucose mutarotase